MGNVQVSKMEGRWRERLRDLTLRGLVCEEAGKEVAQVLILALAQEEQGRAGGGAQCLHETGAGGSAWMVGSALIISQWAQCAN